MTAMRAVVQRAAAARVEVDGEVVGRIDAGLVCFLGIAKSDGEAELEHMLEKVLCLRIFEDERGKMARSLEETGGALLIVSQFTLCADTTRGRRPSFDAAMPPDEAERLYGSFVERAGARVRVGTGRFGADMRVFVENDGPITIVLESRPPPGRGP